MKRNRKAKIIATLGPSSCDAQTIESLFTAGVDIFRLNFSHGTHKDHQRSYDIIREIEQKTGRPIGILADLQGPKLRVANFAAGKATLKTGQKFRLDLSPEEGDETRVNLPHPEIFAALRMDTDLLLDDGKIRLRVERHDHESADTVVITGGDLSNHKGVNVPNVVLPISPLTDKDKEDLAFALDMGVDWVALSFVQRPADVQEIHDLVQGRARIMSKLEKPSAIDHLDDIIDLSDAIMVARGDLGVECPPETVPILQKRIVHKARQAGRPVVVATQMLDSMVHSPTPTRAEASDVATAVYDGADAVMLSAETAAGDYPIDAVTIMDHIIIRVENDPHYRILLDASRPAPVCTTHDAISAAACQVAHTLSVSTMATFTSSGSTTLRAARQRPEVPILCLTTTVKVARQMTLVWGVHPLVCPVVHSFTEMTDIAVKAAYDENLAKWQDQIIITAGIPFGTAGSTNILRVTTIDQQP